MLQIIPVIDIRGDRVVHARGGDRQNYPLLKSKLTQSTDIGQVLADLLTWFPFPRVYIADLDAIEQGQQNTAFFRQLCEKHRQVELWLDSGIKQASQLQGFDDIANLRLVIGSETLEEFSLLTDSSWQGRLILSLDRRHGRLLGNSELLGQTALWTDKVIVMSLDHVGTNQGPALDWMDQLKTFRDDIEWYLAGGVRHQRDLEQVEQSGGTGVLVASALHTGQLDRQMLACFMEQEHRSS